MLSANSSKTLTCLKCGCINKMPAEACEKCKSPLIRGRRIPPKMSKSLAYIKDLVQKFQKDEITSDKFSEALSDLKAFFNKVLNEHMARQIPDDLMQEAKDELMLGRAGIARYLSAMDSLIYYAKNSNLEALEEGLQYAEEATDMLNRALAMNWESFRAFQESIEEHILSQEY
jgi:hypothetical protein